MSDVEPKPPWSKIDPEVLNGPEEESSEDGDEEDKRHSRWRKLGWWALDLASGAFWVYAVTKVFVGDVDRWVVDNVAPSFRWLLDFRLLLLLGLVSVLLVLTPRRSKKWTWIPLYAATFPLVVLLWKIPRYLYRRRNWLLVLGAIHVAVSTVKGLRFGVPVFTALLVGAVLVAADTPAALLWVAFVLLLGSWLASLIRSVVFAFRPSWFVRGQRRILQRFVESDRAWKFFEIDEALRSPEIEVYTREQAGQLMLKACSGLVAYRGGQFWALKLDQYRKSPASMVFSVATICLLFLQALVTFAFVNSALFELRPEQYMAQEMPSAATFLHYSLSSLWVNEISALTASGGIAAAVNVLAGISIAFIVAILLVTFAFGVRQSRDDEVARDEVRYMRQKAESFAERLASEHQQSVQDLHRQLDELGYLFIGVVAYFTSELAEYDWD